MSYSPIHTIKVLVLESTPLMAVCYCTIIKSYNAALMWFYTITVYLFDWCELKPQSCMTPQGIASFIRFLYVLFCWFFLARALYMHMILYCNYYALIVNSLSGKVHLCLSKSCCFHAWFSGGNLKIRQRYKRMGGV